LPRRSPSRRSPPPSETIRYRGQTYPVIDRVPVGRRTVKVLERLGGAGRERLRVWDPAGGATGMRLLVRLPYAGARKPAVSMQRLASSHPSFPQVLETHRSGDECQVLMAWVEGVTLAERLEKSRVGKLPWPSVPDAWKLFRSLCHAVTALHRATNLVHNDLRPDNLLITRRPERFVLVDFGSAWGVGRALTTPEGDGVSPPWSAPERLLGTEPIDFRSDYFSAGVIGYQLLTGETPYDKLGGVAGTLAEASRPKLEPPSRACRRGEPLPAGAWKAIDQCLAACLAITPASRPEGPSQLLEMIDRPYRILQEASPIVGWRRRLIDWLAG